MPKAFKKKSNNSPEQFTGGGSGKDYYSGLQKETVGGKTYAIEPTGEKTLLDEEGDPVMDIEMNPHLYPEYTAKFANNPNPDVEIKPTPGIKDTQDQMAWNQKWNRQEEASRNRSAFRKEVKFQKSLQSSGEEIAGTPKEVAQEIIYPGQDNSVWQNPTGATPEVLQQNRINALVSAGMTVEDATKQVVTGIPVNQTVLPEGSALGMFRGQKQVIMPTPDINRMPNAYKGFAIDMSGYTPEVVSKMQEDYTNVKFRDEYPKVEKQASKTWTKPSTQTSSTPRTSKTTDAQQQLPAGYNPAYEFMKNTYMPNLGKTPIPQTNQSKPAPVANVTPIQTANPNSVTKTTTPTQTPTNTTDKDLIEKVNYYSDWIKLAENEKDKYSLLMPPLDPVPGRPDISVSGGMTIEKWQALPASERILLYDDFMRAKTQNKAFETFGDTKKAFTKRATTAKEPTLMPHEFGDVRTFY